MKTILIVMIALTSFGCFANDGYLYMDLNHFSDDGGKTEHLFLKVKMPTTNNTVTSCDYYMSYTEDGVTRKVEFGSVTVFKMGKKYGLLTSMPAENSEDGDYSSLSSKDVRSSANDLLSTITSSDGYVASGINAGSLDLVKSLIALEGEMGGNVYPFGDITKAYDLTSKEFKKGFGDEGDEYSDTYTLTGKCETETFEE